MGILQPSAFSDQPVLDRDGDPIIEPACLDADDFDPAPDACVTRRPDYHRSLVAAGVVPISDRDGLPVAVPMNGAPATFPESIDHEAIAFRAQGTEIGRFIADQLDRIAQLVRWTGATSPQEHLDRLEIWDAEIAAQHFDRGYEAGLETGRRGA
ncbi:MAG: hypothetical protein ACLQGP_26215 [Isosphaeraceae bacterium]